MMSSQSPSDVAARAERIALQGTLGVALLVAAVVYGVELVRESFMPTRGAIYREKCVFLPVGIAMGMLSLRCALRWGNYPAVRASREVRTLAFERALTDGEVRAVLLEAATRFGYRGEAVRAEEPTRADVHRSGLSHEHSIVLRP